MENKNNYTTPNIEVVIISSDDIIVTSLGGLPFVGEDDDLVIKVGRL